MVEVIDYRMEERPNSLLWTGYAFVLLAILAYIFSRFLAVPLVLIIALLVLGIITLIAGYGTKTFAVERTMTEEKKMFRRREF